MQNNSFNPQGATSKGSYSEFKHTKYTMHMKKHSVCETKGTAAKCSFSECKHHEYTMHIRNTMCVTLPFTKTFVYFICSMEASHPGIGRILHLRMWTCSSQFIFSLCKELIRLFLFGPPWLAVRVANIMVQKVHLLTLQSKRSAFSESVFGETKRHTSCQLPCIICSY